MFLLYSLAEKCHSSDSIGDDSDVAMEIQVSLEGDVFPAEMHHSAG